MGRAEDLFERIKAEGVAAIDGLIEERALEEGYLDFKRAYQDGQGNVLATDDNKNLSKAISGFGNSGGGILIWGIDCRRQADGNEIPMKHLLVDARGFRTKLEGAVSRLSIPPHIGVESLEVVTNEAGAGFVVTKIPSVDFGPVRAEAPGLRNYYVRAGSSFEVVPHDALAGMFGRAPRPSLAIQHVVLPLRRDQPDNRNLIFGVGISVANIGQVIAEDVYASIWRADLSPEHVIVSSQNEDTYRYKQSSLPSYQIHALDGIKLVPGGVDDLAHILFRIPIERPIPVSIEITIGSRSAMPKRSRLSASLERIEDAIQRYANPGSVGRSDEVLVIEDLS